MKAIVFVFAALAAGCARVFVTDVDETKLGIAASLSPAITALNVTKGDASEAPGISIWTRWRGAFRSSAGKSACRSASVSAFAMRKARGASPRWPMPW